MGWGKGSELHQFMSSREIEIFQAFDAIELSGHVGRVRDQDQRHVLFATRFPQQIEHLLLMAGIDVGRRLVSQQELGLIGQRPGDRHPLLLADRKLGRPVRDAMPRPTRSSRFFARGAVGPAAGEPHGQQHVFQGGKAAAAG